MSRHGHGGHGGGHHGGGHHGGGPRGSARGWGRGGRPGPRGAGGWYGWPYPYPVVTEYVESESDLDRKLKEMELLERMKRLSGNVSVSGFEMPSMSTLLLGAAFVGGAYLLMRKR